MELVSKEIGQDSKYPIEHYVNHSEACWKRQNLRDQESFRVKLVSKERGQDSKYRTLCPTR